MPFERSLEIERRLDAIVANDAGMKLIVERLGELLKNLPQIFDQSEGRGQQEV